MAKCKMIDIKELKWILDLDQILDGSRNIFMFLKWYNKSTTLYIFVS